MFSKRQMCELLNRSLIKIFKETYDDSLTDNFLCDRIPETDFSIERMFLVISHHVDKALKLGSTYDK